MTAYLPLASMLFSGLSAILYGVGSLWRVHYDLNRMVASMKAVARFNVAGSAAATIAFACQFVLFTQHGG